MCTKAAKQDWRCQICMYECIGEKPGIWDGANAKILG